MKTMWKLIPTCHARTILKIEAICQRASFNQKKVGKEASFRQRSLPIIVPISLW
jgi:hypothetical protein